MVIIGIFILDDMVIIAIFILEVSYLKCIL